MATGIYRTAKSDAGAEYVYVDYGVASDNGEIPRVQYEEQGYQPSFDDLPTKQEYESKNA